MKRPKPIQGFRKFVHRRRPAINEVLREPTAGGIIYRRDPKNNNQVEILLVQDSRDRWTIPKGHIEEGETPRDTTRREIGEEVGLKEMNIKDWLGKVNFRYRRINSLVLITQEVYLVEALGDTNDIKREAWMNGIAWMPANEALDKIAYEDLGKLILLALKKIRQSDESKG